MAKVEIWKEIGLIIKDIWRGAKNIIVNSLHIWKMKREIKKIEKKRI